MSTTLNITEDDARNVLTELLDNGRDRATIEEIASIIGVHLEDEVTHEVDVTLKLNTQYGLSMDLVNTHLESILKRNAPMGVEVVEVHTTRVAQA